MREDKVPLKRLPERLPEGWGVPGRGGDKVGGGLLVIVQSIAGPGRGEVGRAAGDEGWGWGEVGGNGGVQGRSDNSQSDMGGLLVGWRRRGKRGTRTLAQGPLGRAGAQSLPVLRLPSRGGLAFLGNSTQIPLVGAPRLCPLLLLSLSPDLFAAGPQILESRTTLL